MSGITWRALEMVARNHAEAREAMAVIACYAEIDAADQGHLPTKDDLDSLARSMRAVIVNSRNR